TKKPWFPQPRAAQPRKTVCPLQSKPLLTALRTVTFSRRLPWLAATPLNPAPSTITLRMIDGLPLAAAMPLLVALESIMSSMVTMTAAAVAVRFRSVRYEPCAVIVNGRAKISLDCVGATGPGGGASCANDGAEHTSTAAAHSAAGEHENFFIDGASFTSCAR